ncbi:MAG: cupin fold metalloprotein, WbuC family [Candidatus Omnitrophica bacterium]|nr:cupin fold metalloprotein, WbuC family [Candidatus Omnitrophota bacterium]
MNKVVILGATGFIGSHLTAALKQSGEFDVRALGSSDCNLLDPVDVSRTVRRMDVKTTVIFCSAVTPDRGFTRESMWDNITMVRHFADCLANRRLRALIFLSSSSVFGNPPAALPIREETPSSPLEPYGFSKVMCEELLRKDRAFSNFPVCILRPVIVYGRNDGHRSLVGKFFRQLKRHKALALEGGGREKCDFVNVEDLVGIILRLVKKPYNGTLNVATGRSVSIRQVVEKLSAAMGVEAKMVRRESKGVLKKDLIFDNRKICRLFPKFRFRPVDRGIVDYCRSAASGESLPRGSAAVRMQKDIAVTRSRILQLERDALAAPLRRARICLHRDRREFLQEMVIAIRRDSYVRPHRQLGRGKSYHVISGKMVIVFFDDAGKVIRRVALGGDGSGSPFLYRFRSDSWHTVIPRSACVVFKETVLGPFHKTEFAQWSPNRIDDVTMKDWLQGSAGPRRKRIK